MMDHSQNGADSIHHCDLTWLRVFLVYSLFLMHVYFISTDHSSISFCTGVTLRSDVVILRYFTAVFIVQGILLFHSMTSLDIFTVDRIVAIHNKNIFIRLFISL